MVATGILVLLAMTVISGLAAFRDAAGLEQAVVSVEELLRLGRVQTLASQGETGYGVHFASSTVTLFRGGLYDPATTTNVVVVLSGHAVISALSLSTTTASVMFERLTGESRATGTVRFASERSGRSQELGIGQSGVFFRH